MSGVLCKRILLLFSNMRSSPLHLLHNTFFIKPISSKPYLSQKEEIQQSFTVHYLINSCGLSPEKATSVSKKLHFNSPKKPDSVITLLKNHNFTKTRISKLVIQYPRVLLANPHKTLLPKLEFFHSIGVPSADLVRIISGFPEILCRSLEAHITPTYNYLKSLVHTDERIVYIFKCSAKIFLDGAKALSLNVAVLRELGVCESSIAFLMRNHPTSLMRRNDKFVNIVNRVTEMGFDISKLKFLNAVQVLCAMSKSTWECKKKAFQRWGWSDDDIRLAFSAYPICMNVSEKKIMSAMDFLVNKMNYRSSDIATYPVVLCFSLEKRTIPRCLVVKVLTLKGLKKSTRLPIFLLFSNKKFLDEFVTKYEEHVPQLSDIYQGKMGISEVGFESEETCEVK